MKKLTLVVEGVKMTGKEKKIQFDIEFYFIIWWKIEEKRDREIEIEELYQFFWYIEKVRTHNFWDKSAKNEK